MHWNMSLRGLRGMPSDWRAFQRGLEWRVLYHEHALRACRFATWVVTALVAMWLTVRPAAHIAAYLKEHGACVQRAPPKHTAHDALPRM